MNSYGIWQIIEIVISSWRTYQKIPWLHNFSHDTMCYILFVIKFSRGSEWKRDSVLKKNIARKPIRSINPLWCSKNLSYTLLSLLQETWNCREQILSSITARAAGYGSLSDFWHYIPLRFVQLHTLIWPEAYTRECQNTIHCSYFCFNSS